LAEQQYKAEQQYEVVWPSSPQVVAAGSLAPRLASLDGRTIAFVSDYRFKIDSIFAEVKAALDRDHDDVKTLPQELFGDIHGADENEKVGTLPELLRSHGADAAIVGIGACGSCTPAVLRAAALIEKAGIPTTALISSNFAVMARSVTKSLGVEGISLAVYPGVILTDTEESFAQKVRDVVVPQALDGLLHSKTAPPAREPEPAPHDIVLCAEYDEVIDEFAARGWSEGLPVVPPTLRRVEQFLSFTDRDPDDSFGVLLPARREATIWSIAVNGVMAGCRPEHMPVLVAVVEAIADPRFRVEDAGCTAGWEPMITVSGAIAEQLGFNSVTGALRSGTRANTSVGRFLRLYLRNVAGLRPFPDETDQGAIAQNFHVALAEDEETVQELGWSPQRVDRGFSESDSTVTVRSVVTASMPLYSAGERAEDHLEVIANGMIHMIGPWVYSAYLYHSYNPLLVLCPSIARAIANDGAGKDDIRRYIYEHVLLDGDRAQRFARGVSGRKFDWKQLVATGAAPAEYGSDPTGPVRGLLDPGDLDIVVAGSRGRNQSKAFIGQHRQGAPVTKRVQLPEGWSSRLTRG
jgi:hypothetical protein